MCVVVYLEFIINWIQVRNQSQTFQNHSHMQNMITQNHHSIIFLKRKHKLYKTLAQHIPPLPVDDLISQSHITGLYEFIINKQHQLHQIDYYIKHEFTCNTTKYHKTLIELIWNLKSFRCNHIISFIYYRLSRKYPCLYWNIHQFMQQQIRLLPSVNRESIQILTDLFLYGFPITQQQFLDSIFPSFRPFVLEMIPKYFGPLQNNEAINLKAQKVIKNCYQTWIQSQKSSLLERRDLLLQKSKQLQSSIIKQICSEVQQNSYESQLQAYETHVYHLGIAYQHINLAFQPEDFKLKSIFQLKKECLTFKRDFEPSEYEKDLYFRSNQALKNIKSIKKSEILKIEQHEAYINQVKQCSTIPECVNISGFFIQQMNIQHNRQQLIEIIINQCYYYNNISYIIKVLGQIGQLQPQIHEYCQLKGKKICSQSKMNQKYQRILCQMARFRLIDQNILLEYAEKILKCENNLVTKEIQSILQQLGTIVYYRSLQTHVRINNIFERMQTIIKSKMIHFNVQHLFHLKSILNFLRNYKNLDTISANEITKIEIKNNFKFIFKKMEKLLKNHDYKGIQEYLTEGINLQDFLNVYYYSSLIKELNSKDLNQLIYTRTVSQIFSNISSGNLQNGVKWSRFLGELYSYEIINRKKLIDALNLILNKSEQDHVLVNKIKLICSALQISKEYLLDLEKNSQSKLMIFFLFEVKKVLLSYSRIQLVIQCQIDDIMDFFHPYLSKIKDLEQIRAIQSIQTTETCSKSYSFHNNLYYYLDLLLSGVDALDLAQQSSQKLKPKQKYIEKPIKYMEKNVIVKTESNPNIPPDFEIQSEQSHKTSETIQTSSKKVMKVMGRDKKTKAIRIMTYNYSQQTI